MDAKILTKLDIEHIEGTMNWLLTSDFQFQSAVLNKIVLVPAGFITDFHSVPRVLWSILPPHENPESAVVHDWLYTYNGCTRGEADRVHREVLEVINRDFPGKAPRWKRIMMYSGLRVGGWKPWGEYREKQKARETEGKPSSDK
jgi:hypothetical protein